MAYRRIEMTGGGSKAGGEKRKKTIVLKVDGLPVEVDGRPPGSEWNGHYRQWNYHVRREGDCPLLGTPPTSSSRPSPAPTDSATLEVPLTSSVQDQPCRSPG